MKLIDRLDSVEPYSTQKLASPERKKMGRKPASDAYVLNRRNPSELGDVDLLLKTISALCEKSHVLLDVKTPTIARLVQMPRELTAVRNRMNEAIGALTMIKDAIDRAEDMAG